MDVAGFTLGFERLGLPMLEGTVRGHHIKTNAQLGKGELPTLPFRREPKPQVDSFGRD